MINLLFNIIIPVENFHGFTFKTKKSKAVPADGHKTPKSKCLRRRQMYHWSQLHQHQPLKVSPTLVVSGRVVPHGPFHQSNLIRWGGYKASLFLLRMDQISIWNYAVHLINLILLDLALLCWLLHLDRVAETQRTQEQVLLFLKDRLENQVLNKQLGDHQ